MGWSVGTLYRPGPLVGRATWLLRTAQPRRASFFLLNWSSPHSQPRRPEQEWPNLGPIHPHGVFLTQDVYTDICTDLRPIPPSSPYTRSRNNLEGLFEVGDDVLDVLNSNRHLEFLSGLSTTLRQSQDVPESNQGLPQTTVVLQRSAVDEWSLRGGLPMSSHHRRWPN